MSYLCTATEAPAAQAADKSAPPAKGLNVLRKTGDLPAEMRPPEPVRVPTPPPPEPEPVSQGPPPKVFIDPLLKRQPAPGPTVLAQRLSIVPFKEHD